jgi:hypothetical protein
VTTTAVRHPLLLGVALVWCGVIAIISILPGIAVLGLASTGSPASALTRAMVDFGILLLVPAVALGAALGVAIVQLWRSPPAGRWLAVSVLSCYAAGAFGLPAGQLLEGSAFSWLTGLLALVGAVFAGSAVLVAWTARTGRSAPQGL